MVWAQNVSLGSYTQMIRSSQLAAQVTTDTKTQQGCTLTIMRSAARSIATCASRVELLMAFALYHPARRRVCGPAKFERALATVGVEVSGSVVTL
jgi:hypothetical protein